MKLHANPRSCPNSRRLLVERIEVEKWSVTATAEAAGAEGECGLRDRSSAPEADLAQAR